MFFDLLCNPTDDPRYTEGSAVNLALTMLDTDKGRRLVGAPMTSAPEVEARFELMIAQLKELRREARRHVSD